MPKPASSSFKIESNRVRAPCSLRSFWWTGNFMPLLNIRESMCLPPSPLSSCWRTMCLPATTAARTRRWRSTRSGFFCATTSTCIVSVDGCCRLNRCPRLLRFLEMLIEPGKGILLHFQIELVATRIEVTPVHCRRTTLLERLAHHHIGTAHFRDGVESVFRAIQHHRG